MDRPPAFNPALLEPTDEAPPSTVVAQLSRSFPGFDDGSIRVVLQQVGNNSEAASAVLQSLGTPTGAHVTAEAAQGVLRTMRAPLTSSATQPMPDAGDALGQLHSRFPAFDKDMLRDILQASDGDVGRATQSLRTMSQQPAVRKSPEEELKAAFPAVDQAVIHDIFEACDKDVTRATQSIRLMSQPAVKKPAPLDDLKAAFPDVDQAVIRDIFEAAGKDLIKAAEMLSAMSEPAVPPVAHGLRQLASQYPTYDLDTVKDIYDACGGDVAQAAAMLTTLSVAERRPAPTPEPIDPGMVKVNLGKPFLASNPEVTRRILILLDDSGSMCGANIRTGQHVLNRLTSSVNSVPSKVVIFGSKSETHVCSDWDTQTTWPEVFHKWQGKSGRTWLWECILDFVGIEDARELHLLLITDGEDTESSPPYTGVDGMHPTVERLNQLGFSGEIHIIALGREITLTLGQAYSNLAGATGGTATVLKPEDGQHVVDVFVEQFLNSVAVAGPSAEGAREERLHQYVDKVKRGEAQLVRADAVCRMDKELQSAFAKADERADIVRLASVDRKKRRAEALAAADAAKMSPELRAWMERRQAANRQ